MNAYTIKEMKSMLTVYESPQVEVISFSLSQPIAAVDDDGVVVDAAISNGILP